MANKILIGFFLTLNLTMKMATAEQIGDSYGSASARRNSYVTVPNSVKAMHLERGSLPNSDGTDQFADRIGLYRCDLIRSGGDVSLELLNTRFDTHGNILESSKIGISFFPSELVDLEKPLKNGFKNQVESLTEYDDGTNLITWTAEFKNGLLTIERYEKDQSGPSEHMNHIEIETKTSVLEAEKISWLSPISPSSAICIPVPAG